MKTNWLVTGGAGFIGSHLVERVIARGDAAVVLDDLSTGRFENLAALVGNPAMEFTDGSVTDRPLVASLVARADRVVHLAAAVGVRLIVDEPVRTLETNIHGTEVILKECARRNNADSFVHASPNTTSPAAPHRSSVCITIKFCIIGWHRRAVRGCRLSAGGKRSGVRAA